MIFFHKDHLQAFTEHWVNVGIEPEDPVDE